MKQLFFLFFLVALTPFLQAQECHGIVTESDSVQAPFYLANVKVMTTSGQLIYERKTYYDGGFKFNVQPNQTYAVTVSYVGFRDSVLIVKTNKENIPAPDNFKISLQKDGLRLTGFILDKSNDNPVKDAGIILKNVMTRQEEKQLTRFDGAYNFRLDYETNYLVRIDKRSPGIMNTYQDTAFYISTIGFNKPLDFKLDIKLGISTEYLKPRDDYDPNRKPENKNIKPALEVFGAKDSLKMAQQALEIAALKKELEKKDSVIVAIKSEPKLENKEGAKKAEEATAKLADERAKEKLRIENEAALKVKRDKDLADRLAFEKSKQIQTEELNRKAQKEKEVAAKLADDKAKEKLRIESETTLKAKHDKELADRLAFEKSKQIQAEELNRKAQKEKELAAKLADEKAKEKLRLENEVALKAKRDKELTDKLALEQQKQSVEINRKTTKEKEKQDKTLAKRQLKVKQEWDKETAKLASKEKIRLKKVAREQEKETKAVASFKINGKKSVTKPEVFPSAYSVTQDSIRKAEKTLSANKKVVTKSEKLALQKRMDSLQHMSKTVVITNDYENTQKDLMADYEANLKQPKTAFKPVFPVAAAPKTVLPKIKVKGVVYEGSTSLRLADASITVRMLTAIAAQEVKSDSDGRYSFEVDSGSFYLVSYYKQGYILGKQLLDVTMQHDKVFLMPDIAIAEGDDFNPIADMPAIHFSKNSAMPPKDLWEQVFPIIKIMKEVPQLKLKIYGMASGDESYPKPLSVSRAREIAQLFSGNGIKETRIKFDGYSNTKTRSGCGGDKPCDETAYSKDRVVLYKLVKE